ncbi:bile acid:sodium symporter family protein [Pseudomonas mosselii]|uniref:bile acid:sodium symporter family protein n=1 Tax=Pseudomonas mosselii TaxID=78327 RepID=UPI00244ADA91|nr:bile acid:sodium symporter family protein [Pseudomonas mosselii]MDH0627790.1 bile acid:sodium symporter family protein [Pseudomonas mosselii]MDH0677885.1 bile acid:sodium symporter family protein [Pseudomonas mosselii]MDH0925964.1 bile acid:sodium symporter family protein [Pseudomonas mosselii]MDH1134413.1 bile acid:sodium symporter family protein [Pseudomonas mosselii]MDH1140632.1 bile acid:sodium symporter family protein [Pseudomonas mosselii]
MQTIELARLIAPVLLFVMMIGMGLGLRRKDFVDLLQAPIGVAIGTLGQVLLLPLMGLWVNWVFALDGALALGVIVLCLCPGGVASNTITYLLKGDVALSISLTVISSCIAFISVPLLVALALAHYGVLGQTVQLPMADTVVRLFLLTLLPLALGMGLARLWPTACKRLEPLLRMLGFAFLMLMILVVVVKEYPLLQVYAARLGFSLVALFCTTMGLAWLAAKAAGLGSAQTRSITVEIGIQNSALALVIASLLGSVDMAIPAILYSVLVCLAALLVVTLHAIAARWRVRPTNPGQRPVDPFGDGRLIGQHSGAAARKD